jgi:excisionase family DNA binding protein
MMPDLMTRQEVADYLRVPLKTVEEWAYRGGFILEHSKR